jgi:hypothetical protein
MNSKLKLLTITILYMVAFLPVCLFAEDNTEKIKVENIVNTFCKAEFVGIQDARQDGIKFSPSRKNYECKRDSLFEGSIVTWEVDPLVIVKSYQIISVQIKKDFADVKVQYNQLGITTGDFDKRILIQDRKNPTTVDFHLIKNKGKWWIYDPPVPRISKESLIIYYKEKIKELEGYITSSNDESDHRKPYLKKLKDDLSIIEKL